MIGGNNPPPEATFGMHIDDLFSLLSDTLAGGEVKTPEQEAAIDGLLDDFRNAAKDADKARADEKKPHDEAGKQVQAKWKPITEKADRGVAACKAALTPYRIALQRAKDEAAHIAREEAEAKVKAAMEAIAKADDLETAYLAEQQVKAAGKLEAQANRIERSPTGLRTSWEAKITDRTAALKSYLNRHPEAFVELIQRLADQDARGARPQVPGITYHQHLKAA